MHFWVLLLCGLLLHFIFLASVFDVYFNSPVIHGIKEYKPSYVPESKRLVLIVADGLRARSFFFNHSISAPYLRSIIEKRGSWGVSHTHVPTESRPGHVAMIAGLYEDPSAVTKGWTENPVEFDSVFNRSSHTWAWGSQDILPMFAKGEASGRVSTHTYPRSMQRFSGDKSNEKLDTWVLDRVLNFFDKSRDHKGIHKPGVIIFLHLLGLDTTGHATKPHSRQYIDNIRLVDTGVRRVEEAVERFYNHDGRTSYIFTADHGMTDWGSHGSGLPDETETPLVVWGAGVSGPQYVENDVSPKEWGLSKLRRRDVQQADIAALMSALLALPTPTNNVGLLPRNYLLEGKWVTQAVLSNVGQLLLQFERAQELIERKLLPLFFHPFPLLAKLNLGGVEKLVTAGHDEDAMLKAEEIFKIALEGIQYYLDYYRNSLKFAVTMSHFLWLAYLGKSLLNHQQSCANSDNFIFYSLLSICIFAALVILLLVLAQNMPLQYVIYYSLPFILVWAVFQDVWEWWPSLVSVIRNHYLIVMISIASSLFAIALLVCSFFHRVWLSVGLILLAMWPVAEYRVHGNIGLRLCLAWSFCCVCLATFPMLPVIGSNANYDLVLASGTLISLAGFVLTFLLRWIMRLRWIDTTILALQSFMAGAAAVNVYNTSINFAEGFGLTWNNQIISWTILGMSSLLPLCSSTKVGVRLTSTWLSLSSVLTLLSVSHELLFLLLLLLAMSIFPAIEHKLVSTKPLLPYILIQKYNKKNQSQEKVEHTIVRDLRKSYFYLFFTVLAFFGLGNVASLNSFDPAWVRCLVTTFDPFLMGSLILLKTIAPFLAVACGVRTAALLSQRPVQWLLVLGLCDALALPFFHFVVTTGSWLDIGQSISHFVIAHVCILLLLLLHFTAHLWLSVGHKLTSKVSSSEEFETLALITKDHGE